MPTVTMNFTSRLHSKMPNCTDLKLRRVCHQCHISHQFSASLGISDSKPPICLSDRSVDLAKAGGTQGNLVKFEKNWYEKIS